MFGRMARYEEERRQREKRKNQASFAAGAALGMMAGYCAKKYLVPKLMEIEVKALIDKETSIIKDTFEDLKQSIIGIKERFGFDCCCSDEDCCCCSDEDCCCCDDETCCCEDGECCCDDEKGEEGCSCCCESKEDASETTSEETSSEDADEEASTVTEN